MHDPLPEATAALSRSGAPSPQGAGGEATAVTNEDTSTDDEEAARPGGRLTPTLSWDSLRELTATATASASAAPSEDLVGHAAQPTSSLVPFQEQQIVESAVDPV